MSIFFCKLPKFRLLNAAPLFLLLFLILFSFLSSIFDFNRLKAATLLFISDTIENSQPATSTNHLIKFTLTNPVPASGKIYLEFVPNFVIPDDLDYTDVDFLVDNVNWPLAANPGSGSGSAVGLTVFATASPPYFRFTLNDTDSLAAASSVTIKIGTNAQYGEAGDRQIKNPYSLGSYRIRIKTKTPADSLIDEGAGMIAIIAPVEMAVFDYDPPVRFNGWPTGELPGSTEGVVMSLETDEWAYCRYATTSGVNYDAMTNNFSASSSYTFHYTTITGLTPNTSYVFYVRCKDRANNKNPDDYEISFSVGPPVPSPGPGGEGGGGAGGGAGGGGGAGMPYPPPPEPPQVKFEGLAYPSVTVYLLKDGQQFMQTQSDGSGRFVFNVYDLPQGTYHFGIWARDSEGLRSITYSAVVFLTFNIHTTISNVYLPPTIKLAKEVIQFNEKLEIKGRTIPQGLVEILIQVQEKGKSPKEISREQSRADAAGQWNLSRDVANFLKGIYQIKPRLILTSKEASEWGQVLNFGVGVAPAVDFSLRADINKDGRVNLIDFSILIYYWNRFDPDADINMDGVVNLTDFSIMIAYWTG